VVHQEPLQGFPQVGRSVAGSQSGIATLEKAHFILQRIFDALVYIYRNVTSSSETQINNQKSFYLVVLYVFLGPID
jgi:hypothetical protein